MKETLGVRRLSVTPTTVLAQPQPRVIQEYVLSFERVLCFLFAATAVHDTGGGKLIGVCVTGMSGFMCLNAVRLRQLGWFLAPAMTAAVLFATCLKNAAPFLPFHDTNTCTPPYAVPCVFD